MLKSNGDFDKPTNHSSIIGWAYDGNPIYGHLDIVIQIALILL